MHASTKHHKAYPALLPAKHFHHTITTGADHPPAILTPHDRAHALSSHQPVAGDFLRATPFLQRPEAKAGIMTG